jgi:hypothetical protein
MAVTDTSKEESSEQASEPAMTQLLSQIGEAAAAVAHTDAVLRSEVKVLAERFTEQARMAHVYASSQAFDLVEDTWGQGHGVYGHLGVGPQGFYLATRSELDDVYESELAPDGEKLYKSLPLQDWPVDLLRLVVEKNLMEDLARSLLQAMREQVAHPKKRQVLPPDVRKPSPEVVELAQRLKFYNVIDGWRDAQRELIASPAGALRAACSLLESACKHIIHKLGAEPPGTATLANLYKATERILPMIEDEKRLASGLRAVVDGIAHGRSHLSDAHGQGPEDSRPTSPHAELAVTAAGALAVHLMRLAASSPSVAKVPNE